MVVKHVAGVGHPFIPEISNGLEPFYIQLSILSGLPFAELLKQCCKRTGECPPQCVIGGNRGILPARLLQWRTDVTYLLKFSLNRRELLSRLAGYALALPVMSSIIAACVSGDDDENPTTLSASETPASVATATGTPARITPSSPTPSLIPSDLDVIVGLQELAISFDTAEPESGFADLTSLREMVGDARIVALGEATHGTSEFFTMKHRLTEFLVIEMGFTIFAVEAPWPATKVINHYVHTGEGMLSEVIQGLSFWVWKTREVLDLIEWIRDYNTRPGVTPVSFQGFDMQVGLDDIAVNQVLAYVNTVDSDAVERFEGYYAAFPHDFSATADDADLEGAQAAFADLIDHRDEFVQQSSSGEFEEILHTARMIVQSEERLLGQDVLERGEIRDQYMAENVAWLLDQAGPEARMALWAHNVHVAAAPLVAGDGALFTGMGSHLREHYEEELVAVGFDFFSGNFRSIGQGIAEGKTVHQIPLPSPEQAEYTFAQLGLARFMLDLQSAQAGTPAGDWLAEEHIMWAIGFVFDPESPELKTMTLSFTDSFDVLIYFHETSASHLL